MDQAARGATALKASDFPTAIKLYTEALSHQPNAVDYYLKRSTAYQRSTPPDCASALNDAEVGLVLAVKRAKYELITQSQMRRGIALFGLGKWADAKYLFELVKKRNEKEPGIDVWIKKAENKLATVEEGDEARKVTIKEVPDVEAPKPEVQQKEKKEDAPASSETSASTPAAAPAVVQTPPSKIKHDWYQNGDNVYFTLLAKGVPKEKAVVEIHAKTLSISFPTTTGSTYDFSLEPLFEEVDPSQSTFRITPTKVEVVLRKAKSGIKWDGLEGTASASGSDEADSKSTVPRSVLTASGTSKPPAYPTSSKGGPKNWDKVVDDLTKKPSKDGKKDGPEDSSYDADPYDEGDEANDFFRKLYANADPDTRRAMVKSYQESNGTALSTDWKEVSKGPVKTSPPDGMEAHKW